MSFSKGKQIKEFISLESILSKTSEFDLLSYYLNINTIPTLIPSPFREDNTPSFGLFTPDGEKIFYQDFGTGEKGNTFTLLSKVWGISYIETLEKIYKSLPKNSINIFKNNLKHKKIKIQSKDTKLDCKVRQWRKYDLEYWEQYGISLKWLKFGEIYPISHIITSINDKVYYIPADKYAYVYVERKDSKISLKIYQPYNISYKWRNNHDYSVWDLWTKLPDKGEKLIITSSRKDALCIWENTGIPAISLQAESCLPKKQVIEELKKRFTYIYILYDNDFKSEESGKRNNGRLLGAKIAEQFELIQIEIPRIYNSKDPSDLCLNHNRDIVKQTILTLINAEKQ